MHITCVRKRLFIHFHQVNLYMKKRDNYVPQMFCTKNKIKPYILNPIKVWHLKLFIRKKELQGESGS